MTHLTSPDRPRSQSMEAHKYLPTALALIFCANAACAGAQSLPATAWREPIAEVDGANANILHLPVITVSDKAATERAMAPSMAIAQRARQHSQKPTCRCGKSLRRSRLFPPC